MKHNIKKYIFPRSGNQTKRGVEFRNSILQNSVGSGERSVLMRTEYFNTRFPGSLCLLWRTQRKAKKEKYIFTTIISTQWDTYIRKCRQVLPPSFAINVTFLSQSRSSKLISLNSLENWKRKLHFETDDRRKVLHTFTKTFYLLTWIIHD